MVNKNEPGSGWRYRYNAWYYRVPKSVRHLWDNKTEYRLGSTLREAWEEWDSQIALQPDPSGSITFSALLSRYQRDVLPHKSWKSQESNLISIRRLVPVFGNMRIEHIKTHHVANYRDKVAVKHGRTSANRDIEVLSHAYTKAQEWGYTEHRPRVLKLKTPPRDRYVDNWELEEFLKVSSPALISYVWLKLVTGQRRKDLLLLKLDDIRTDTLGIPFKPSKTALSSGYKVLIPWDDELARWRNYALSVRPETQSDHVFVNSKGQPWIKQNGTANGFDTLWSRTQRLALEKTDLKERFQEKDLRAKTASDTDLNHASRLLVHTTEETTKLVYRRKGDIVNAHQAGDLFKRF